MRRAPARVQPHQARVADHIGGKDGGEATLDAFFGHVECLPSEQPSGEIVWMADS